MSNDDEVRARAAEAEEADTAELCRQLWRRAVNAAPAVRAAVREAIDRLMETAEDASDIAAAELAMARIEAGEPTVPWEQVKAELADLDPSTVSWLSRNHTVGTGTGDCPAWCDPQQCTAGDAVNACHFSTWIAVPPPAPGDPVFHARLFVTACAEPGQETPQMEIVVDRGFHTSIEGYEFGPAQAGAVAAVLLALHAVASAPDQWARTVDLVATA